MFSQSGPPSRTIPSRSFSPAVPTAPRATNLLSAPQGVAAEAPGAGVESGLEFDILLGVCAQISEVKPVEQLLNDLLLQARRMTRAEAGTVLIAAGDRLRFVCTQNDARPDLARTTPIADRHAFMAGAPGSAATFQAGALAIDDSSIAGHVAKAREALRIDDVYRLPAGSPFRFDSSVDQKTGYRCGSMLVVPLQDRTGHLAGVMQLINRREDDGSLGTFSERDQTVAVGLASLAAVSVRNAQMRDELARSHLDTILRLATAAEFRDGETSEHIRRVSLYCETVARTLGMPTEWCQLMLFASPMHDIGKLGVPDAILQKPGKLTAEERTAMEAHTTIGGQILAGSSNDLIRVAERIALSHHEKWDGSGYPGHVAGPEIPLEGRITAVADVFDALTSKRVYKPAFDLDWSINEIVASAGKHFDPAVVEAFVAARPEIEAVFELYTPQQHAG